jgi:hypothetical protein
MSKGAIKEMLRASLSQFERMVKDVPISDRKIVLKSLVYRVDILECV